MRSVVGHVTHLDDTDAYKAYEHVISGIQVYIYDMANHTKWVRPTTRAGTVQLWERLSAGFLNGALHRIFMHGLLVLKDATISKDKRVESP